MSISFSEIVKVALGCIYVAMLIVILTSKDYKEARGAIVIALSSILALISVL